jgi:protein SSD1
LSYGDVQNVISGSKLDAKISEGHQTSEVEEDIKNLHSLASKLRARRVAAGAMLSKKLKVKFSLDDKKRPIDCEPYETKEANHLVEEVSCPALKVKG